MLVEYRYRGNTTNFPHFLSVDADTEISAYLEFWRVIETVFDEADDVYIVGIVVEEYQP